MGNCYLNENKTLYMAPIGPNENSCRDMEVVGNTCECQLCNPNFLVNPDYMYCGKCTVSVPVCSVSNLVCFQCPRLVAIPQLLNLKSLNCKDCVILTYLPNLPNLECLECDGCTLLCSWVSRTKSVRFLVTKCPLFFVKLNIHTSREDFDSIGVDDFEKELRRKQFRNGLAPRFVISFISLKKFYLDESVYRITIEVSNNAILYAPGGDEYLKLIKKYSVGVV